MISFPALFYNKTSCVLSLLKELIVWPRLRIHLLLVSRRSINPIMAQTHCRQRNASLPSTPRLTAAPRVASFGGHCL
ncbi:hypothetical protein HMPREF3214_01392 [Alloscardovia omnicolens]|nr:hypothetical protein HMPREF3214_01392 [Alloscardovia omnicolens]